MLGEKSTIMCIFVNTNHSFKKQSEIYENLNKLYIGVPIGVTSAFVLTSNLMLIYGFYKTSRPYTIITKLFIYLSFVDIGLNLVVSIYIYLTMLESLPCFAVFIMFSLIHFMNYLETSLFATISFLRYQSIRRPLHLFDKRYIVIVLIGQFIFCGILGWSFISLFYFDLSSEQMVNTNYAVPVLQFLTVSFVLSVNLMSYKRLKSMKKMTGFTNNVGVTLTQRQKIMSEANKCLLYITAFYLICPLPLFIVSIFGLERLLGSSWGYYIFVFIYVFYLSNGGINTLIFILRTKNLREFFREKCCCCCQKMNKSTKNQKSTEMASIQEM